MIENTEPIGDGDAVVVEYKQNEESARIRLHVLASVARRPGSWAAAVHGKRVNDSVQLAWGEGNTVDATIIQVYHAETPDLHIRSL